MQTPSNTHPTHTHTSSTHTPPPASNTPHTPKQDSKLIWDQTFRDYGFSYSFHIIYDFSFFFRTFKPGFDAVRVRLWVGVDGPLLELDGLRQRLTSGWAIADLVDRRNLEQFLAKKLDSFTDKKQPSIIVERSIFKDRS